MKNTDIKETGSNNKVEIKTKEKSIKRIKIIIEGDNNQVILEEGGTNVDITLHIKGNNNLFFLDKNYRTFKSNVLLFGENQRITIGKDAHFGGVGINAQENTSVIIGDEPLFSYQTEIRTTDSHSVVDVETGERVNHAKSIVLGNRVWMNTQVMISKGVTLGNDVIIGAKALVVKSFKESNIAIGGVPAKVIKTGVTWNRDRL